MKLQRILYNQLNKEYIYEDISSVFVLHTQANNIATWTSAWNISLNVYSLLISYAASKVYMDDMWWEFSVVTSWKAWLLNYFLNEECNEIIVMDSCEAYVSTQLHHLQEELENEWYTLSIRPNQQFLIDHETFTQQYKEPPVMETFYRWMRKKTWLLMEDGKPQWWKRNYDKENRKFDRTFIDVDHVDFWSDPYRDEACELYKEKITAWGKNPIRYMPITHEESQQLLQYFLTYHLDRFGELEDAMYTTSDFVHHSLLSIPLNYWLLTPQEVIQAIAHTDTHINNKEWFIRQVLGRREYMYHWFHVYKDELYEKNFFEHTRKLPKRFWRSKESPLKMNCVNTVLNKVDRLWYAHHIERLMIIGNFTLLIWADPHHVNKRFWEQYADAFERVVTPNVLWMSQYADGWNLATKPYVASANYVNKMSNYCKTCFYDPKEKYGERACPLNFLYWKFIDTHKETFSKWRQSFIVNHLKKIDMETITKQQQDFIHTYIDEHDVL